MTSLQLRSELKDIIDRIRDNNVLEALRTLALRQAQQDEDEDEMMRVALQSEEDIKAGKVYSREEVEQWLKANRDR